MKHLTLFGVLACLPIGLVMAHHSINAEYDLEVPVSLDGVITRVEWQSPHILYYIDALICCINFTPFYNLARDHFYSTTKW